MEDAKKRLAAEQTAREASARKMKRIIKFWYRLLFPGTAAVILSAPISASLLIYTFLIAGDDSPIAYVSYVGVRVLVDNRMYPCCAWIRNGAAEFGRIRFVSQYIEDIPLKMRVSALYFFCRQSAVCRIQCFYRNLLSFALVWISGSLLYLSVHHAFPAGKILIQTWVRREPDS